MLALAADTELIRLQCYEGLNAEQALYEWNYQKQLLALKMIESEKLPIGQKEDLIFSEVV